LRPFTRWEAALRGAVRRLGSKKVLVTLGNGAYAGAIDTWRRMADALHVPVVLFVPTDGKA